MANGKACLSACDGPDHSMTNKKLIVIAEVSIDVGRRRTVNRSVNEILISYKRHFDEVHYVGPSTEEFKRMPGISDSVYLSSLNCYGKPIRKRFSYYMKYPAVKRRFRELIDSGPADIVQLRIPSLFSMAAYPAVKMLGLPLTTYIAGDWQTSFAGNYRFPGNHLVAKGLHRLQQSIIKNSAAVTAGPILARQYAGLTDCHPYFSTTHRDVYARKGGFPPCRLLFVGRLEPLKRLSDAIEAVGLLKKQGVDVTLSIVGDGVMREQLKQLTEALELSDRISFKGQIGDSESLKQIYLAADILVLPSISEGTPKVLPEAMAHGVVPIAVAGVGSNDFIIEHGHNGFLVRPKSSAAMAKAVKMLLGAPQMHEEMVRRGYDYAQAHTLDKEVDKMWGFVNSELERNTK